MYGQRSERELRPTSHTPRTAQGENRTRYDWDRITTLYSNLTQAAELQTRATEPSPDALPNVTLKISGNYTLVCVARGTF